ncbi:ABC transporter substrate-binding protein [Streptomyces sp. NPDC005931]|uniref:ABC transporter substrate-binding protein n=1 Tax=Streptomyces sp. NPDC005931 TaxID=3364737 RepID=UPI003677F728
MRWTRTAGRILLAVTLIGTGFVGCTATEPETRDTAGRGPLTLVTGEDLTGYLDEVLDEWNRARPREKVTLVELPEAADEVRAQMVTSLKSDSDRYDVLNIDVAWTSEFAAAGWISPLNADRFPIKSFLPPVVGTATFDGRLYALPYVTNAGLLYYRRDILEKEGEQPPRTWAELERLARTVAPKYGLGGYAGQFLPYEGLTVNTAEAVQAQGGSILVDEGRRVTVDSPAARRALESLAGGVRDGWIPREALTYKEEESRLAFQDGRLLFLRNWPYVHALASADGSKISGRFGVMPLPGTGADAVGILGGSNLALNTDSRHRASADDLLAYLTSESVQRRVLVDGGLPPVRADLYTEPGLVRRYPYLPILREAVLAAKPRPKSPRYDQVNLAIQAVVHDTMAQREAPAESIARLNRELEAIARQH